MAPKGYPYSGRCAACDRMTYPSYTADNASVPELFEVNVITCVFDLCTACMGVLEDAVRTALIDRLVARDGVSA
jgi:hypothetical protein